MKVWNFDKKRLIETFPALIRYLRQERPDALLSALSNPNILAVAACRLACRGTRIVVSEHNTLGQVWQNSIGSYDILSRFLPLSLRNADGIVAVSHGAAQDLAQQCAIPLSRITVIYNPIIPANWHKEDAKTRTIPHPWLEDRLVPVVLGAGRLCPAKDFSTLLRAFAKLRRITIARLVILGEGEERTALENLACELNIRSDVLLPGFVTEPQAWMSRCQLFVLSSRWEGFGNVLVEALACGIPVISTNCPSGPTEILEDGKWGQLVPVGNPEMMAAAMHTSIKTGPSSSSDSFKRAQYFSVERATDAYLKLLLL